MIETRTLAREVVKAVPDGKAVTIQETCDVEIRFPNGIDESPDKSYTLFGQWRLLPKPKAVCLGPCIEDVISVARTVFPRCATAGGEPTFSAGANQAIDLIESTFRNRGAI